MATLDELTTPLTVAEIQQAIYDAIEALGVKTTSWKPGAVARTIIAGASIVLAGFSLLQQRIAQSGFLELAVGDWLTVVAKEVYNVDRDVGSFAAGECTLDNTGGGVFAPGIGDVIALNTTTGKTYRNTAAFTLAAFETGKIVPFEAIEIGADSTAAPADIDALETVLLGVTITNVSAIVGKDPESDADLRVRCLAKTGTLSPNGPADAYRFLALSAETDSGASAGVTRVTTVPDGAGGVTVYVATATGPVTGSIGDTTTPLGAVDEAIQTKATPLAVTSTTVSAIAAPIAVTYEIWLRSAIGLTVSEIGDAVSLALSNFLSTQPIGGSSKTGSAPFFVFVESLEAVIAEAVGTANLISLEVTAPAADVAIAANEAAVLSGAPTATINLVS